MNERGMVCRIGGNVICFNLLAICYTHLSWFVANQSPLSITLKPHLIGWDGSQATSGGSKAYKLFLALLALLTSSNNDTIFPGHASTISGIHSMNLNEHMSSPNASIKLTPFGKLQYDSTMLACTIYFTADKARR